MVVGFNHNFRYKGGVYHIQTEDSGLKSPNIVTLLYQGGTILASKKTSYADIAKVDNLEQVVEELMKEQHKDMLRKLKSGHFDEVIARFQAGKQVTPVAEGEGANQPGGAVPPEPAPASAPQVRPAPAPPATAKPAPVSPPAESPPAKKQPSSSVETSLDEVILSYLMGDE